MGFGLFLDLNLSAQQEGVLSDLGLARSQALSWSPENRNDSGVRKLLEIISAKWDVEIEIKNEGIELSEPVQSIADCFSQFFEAAFRRLTSDPSKIEKPILYGFNLMPFHLGATFVDKLGRSLYAALLKSPNSKNIPLIFLTRNIDWFVKSQIFREFINLKLIDNPVSVADFRGYGVLISPNKDDLPMEIPRDVFQEILRFKKGRLYNTLIYQTNSFIGHFALENSHIRTHYDLYEFVGRDDVSEHLNHIVHKMIEGHDRVSVIGVGLEYRTVSQLGYQFCQQNSPKIRRFEAQFPEKILDNEIQTWCEDSDCILVLTDIVNSGKTLMKVVSRLRSLNYKRIPIKVFSVLCMSNSPSSIYDIPLISAIKIRREYYEPSEEKCPLCRVRQPLHTVKTVDDFSYVNSDQLTPLDFWELAHEAKAFSKKGIDPQGRQFLYRIDTLPFFENYRKWICNVIRWKFNVTWPGIRPDVIFTIKGEPGERFAELVIQALSMSYISIVSAARSDLQRATPSGLPMENPLKERGKNVLIVDDGMNRGATMLLLIQFCRAAEARPIGGMVFDNRLPKEEVESLENKMGGQKIISLYNWISLALEG